MAIQKLKAFKFYSTYLSVRGQEPDPDLWFDQRIKEWTTRYNLQLQIVAGEKADAAKGPTAPTLKSFDDWEPFELGFLIGLRTHRSVGSMAPLNYVLREVPEVTAEQWDADYPSYDDDMIATHEHTGVEGINPNFARDNRRVFDILKPLVQEGRGNTLIREFDATRDGRAAYMALKAHCMGEGPTTSKRAKAYGMITRAQYTGKSRNFTFDDYILQHKKAHLMLEETGEPLAETKKVTDFLAGINCEKLEYGKTYIHMTPALKASFHLTQNHLMSYLKAIEEAPRPENRQLRSAQTEGRGGRGRGGRGGRGRGGRSASPGRGGRGRRGPRTGHYEKEEWAKLTPEQRAEVTAARLAKKRTAAAAAAVPAPTATTTEARLTSAVASVSLVDEASVSEITPHGEPEVSPAAARAV